MDLQNISEGNFKITTNKSIILMAGSIIAGYAADEKVREILNKNRNKNSEKFVLAVNDLGHYKVILPIFAAGYSTGYIIKDERLKAVSFSSLESAISAGTLTLILKKSIGRARPYMEEGSDKFEFFSSNDDYNSFPSGHSALAWAFFTPYAKEYGKEIYLIPLSLSFARIYKDKHWSSDVIAGAVIGYLCGTFFYDLKDKNYTIYPTGFVYNF